MIRQCQVSYTPGSALIHPLILSLASRARVFILSSFQQGGTNRPPTLAASTPGFPVFNPAAPTQGRSHLFQLQRRPSSTPHPPRHREIEALRVVMSDCLLFNSCGTRVFEMEGLSGMVESKSSATLVRLQLPLQLPRQFSSHTGFISVHPEDLQLNLTSHLSEQLQLFPLLSRANQTTSL